MSRDGYSKTSFQEIANRVGLHKSTLFHYFSTKEELLLTILEKPLLEGAIGLRQIVSCPELEPEAKLEKAIHNQLRVMMSHRNIVKIFLNDIKNLSRKNRSFYVQLRKNYQKEFLKIILEMKSKGYFQELDASIVTPGILGMLNWVVRWYRKKGPLSLDEISRIFYVLLRGHGTGKAKDSAFRGGMLKNQL